MKGVFALMLTAALLLGASAAAEKRKVEPLLLPMPLYNQHDYAEPVFTWHERDVTVEESGCGAACVAMVVGYFEPDDAPEPDDVMSLAGELGLYRGDGLGRNALRLLLDEYGVEGRWRKMDAQAIENTLRKGYPIVEYVGAGYFTENGHYVVLRGITEDGKLLVADPNSEGKDDAEDVSLRHYDSAGKRGLSLYDLRKRERACGDGTKESAQRSAKRK